MICSILDRLRGLPVESVVLAVGYGGDAFAEFCKTYGAQYPWDFEVVSEPLPRGTGGALRALQLTVSDGLFVFNGDTVLDMDLAEMLNFYRNQVDCLASMGVVKMEDTGAFGRVEVGADQRVLGFHEKGTGFIGRSCWLNAGVYIFSSKGYALLPERDCFSLEREVFPDWLGQGFYAFQSDGSFCDLGLPETYLAAQLKPGSWYSDDLESGLGLEWSGSNYVGPNCKIGEGCRLRNCHLEVDVQLGEGCHLSGCLVARGTRLPPGTMAENVLFGGDLRRAFGGEGIV